MSRASALWLWCGAVSSVHVRERELLAILLRDSVREDRHRVCDVMKSSNVTVPISLPAADAVFCYMVDGVRRCHILILVSCL
ncbi:hypothetical protein GGS21DRAFT_526041 [Xylaria nigripes]|nr:hypothetical protein GGS21DRAFT_526041 [Xylaria nigripes]